MSKTLLDFVFNVTALAATPAPSVGWLRKVCVVCAPASGVSTRYVEITSELSAASYTDNAEIAELFDGGMTSVGLAVASSLGSAEELIDANDGEFFTVLVSSDFSGAEGSFASFPGVVGVSFEATAEGSAETYAATENRCAFMQKTGATHGAKNMFYAFGKLLASALRFSNQQFITMPYDDEFGLGDAENYFDERLSFVLTDDDYGKRLAFLCCGGKAIVAPYVLEEIQILMQGRALSYITANQPAYTKKNASRLEDYLEGVYDAYITTGQIESGSVDVELLADDFEASALVTVARPRALWRVEAEITQE